ncbi:MAG: SLC13 family permease [Candidatus Marinimicrobia bacterium]|nr:SLC13 family permease [Candidatus Neomarinimicrobiota bacterium]
MSFPAIFAIILIVFMIAALAREYLRPGLVLFTVLVVFMIAGIVTTRDMLAGFSNKGMITVAILFLVSAGIAQTGALDRLARRMLPLRSRKTPWLLIRIMPFVSFLSAFLNNTPVVIIFAPMVKKWADKLRIPASKFLIPLSYATIFGGMCTLIGTSTNLVVHGLMLENGFSGLGMFELALVGIPVALAGYIYMLALGHRLLPKNTDYLEDLEKNPREYLTEMTVAENSPLAGKSIKDAGLRNLKGVFLMAIERRDTSLETVNEEEIIYAGDRLLFTGMTDQLEDLNAIPGLISAADASFDADFRRIQKKLVEVVVSPQFPGIGKSIRDFNFRSVYRAVVVAVHRNGRKIKSRIGDVRLKAGDNLILLTTKNFSRRWKNSQDFYMVSDIRDVNNEQKKAGKAPLAIGILTLMILGATFGKDAPFATVNQMDMFFFAAIAAVLMAWTGLYSSTEYTRYINWDVLITIACAFGISRALQNTGAADMVAGGIISAVSRWGALGVLGGIYFVTMLFTEIITNNAAAALMFPIALAAARKLGVDPQPFFIAICIAASASFSTPIGYQTNLLVQGIGGYKFRDYLKVGLPMNIISMLISLLVIPLFWKF